MRIETDTLSAGEVLCYIADIEDEDEDEISETVETQVEKPKKPKSSKVSIKEKRKNDLLDTDIAVFTVDIVMKQFKISDQTAKLLLVDLENEMKLIKFGRGPTSIWKRK